MTASPVHKVAKLLHRIVQLHNDCSVSDGKLVEAFVARNDEAAFEALVRRHGPMVMGVCRRVLRNPVDAEDACQATFLVLVRRAGAIVPPEMVGNWLHGVAYRCALKLKTTDNKRQARQKQVADMPEPMAPQENLWNELEPLLEQELGRLPEKYRIAIILCDLEGKTRKEAARQLGWPEGSVSSRLARARTMLANRLTRLGIALSAGSLATLLAENSACAAVPAGLIGAIVKAGILVATEQALAANVASVKVAALTEGVLKSMVMTRITNTLSLLLAASLILASGGVLTCGALASLWPQAKASHVDVSAPALTMHSFRGGPRHTGVCDSTGALTQPVIRWRLATDGPIRSSPLVVGATLYVGSGDGYLRAVDVVSGRERWRFETGGSVGSSPCFADEVVYVASRDGHLYAVAADSGQLRWRFSMGEDLPFHWGFEYFMGIIPLTQERGQIPRYPRVHSSDHSPLPLTPAFPALNFEVISSQMLAKSTSNRINGDGPLLFQ
jgi:RNA polymerase sigma factor (sigma-70 family)